MIKRMLVAVCLSGVVLCGCQKAGKEIDSAVETAGDAAQDAGDAIEEATDK